MTIDIITLPPVDDAPVSKKTRNPLVPLLLVLGGVILLLSIAIAQERQRMSAPLTDAVLVAGEEPPWPEAQEVRLRTLAPRTESLRGRLLTEFEKQPAGEAVIAQLGLRRGPRVAFTEVPDAFAEALEWGRMPEPGKPEILAGDLAMGNTVRIPPVTFEVVGQLRPGTPVFVNTYILPAHPHFRALFGPEDIQRTAWLDVAGRARMREMAQEGPDAIARLDDVEATARMRPDYALGAIFALALMAVGGSLSQYRLLRILGLRRAPFFLRRVLVDWAERPKLAFFIHFVLYGAFLGAMAVALAQPRLNLQMYEWTRYMFSEGELGYVGAAYDSGNIFAATAATFFHNYAIATVLAGMLPSLFFPFWAFFKNIISFGLAGFVLAPLWADSVLGYTYHGITMVLELEAYVVASFAAVMFVVHIARGIRAAQVGAGIGRGLATMATAVVLIGIMLAIAALYEATTLILIGGG